jgi:DNA polymerase-3 subunit beta
MKISINLNTLKSVAHAVGKEETRYYLQGVHLEAGKDGFTMVATNGHKLLCAFQPYGEHMPSDHMQSVIIPASLIAKIKIKKKAYPWAELTVDGDNLTFDYMGETYGGKAIDGLFPDWRRVVPGTVSGETAQFNGDYIATLQKAGNVFLESDKAIPHIHHNGESPSLVTFGGDKFFGVLMPVRSNDPMPDLAWALEGSPIVTQAAAE